MHDLHKLEQAIRKQYAVGAQLNTELEIDIRTGDAVHNNRELITLGFLFSQLHVMY